MILHYFYSICTYYSPLSLSLPLYIVRDVVVRDPRHGTTVR